MQPSLLPTLSKLQGRLFVFCLYCMKEKHMFICLNIWISQVIFMNFWQFCKEAYHFSTFYFSMLFFSEEKNILKGSSLRRGRRAFYQNFKSVYYFINKCQCCVIIPWNLNKVIYFFTVLSANKPILIVLLFFHTKKDTKFHKKNLVQWDKMLS